MLSKKDRDEINRILEALLTEEERKQEQQEDDLPDWSIIAIIVALVIVFGYLLWFLF